MPNLLFDVDGCLYKYDTGEYPGSLLHKQVRYNTEQLLSVLSGGETTIDILKSKYPGEYMKEIIYKEYGISKQEYLNTVWNIEPQGNIIPELDNYKLFFNEIKSKKFTMFAVSDGPSGWINRVLKYFDIRECFLAVYSGETDITKKNGLLYNKVIEEMKIDPKNSFMVGDDIESDIIKAKEKGIHTIHLSRQGKKTADADFTITNLEDLLKII